MTATADQTHDEARMALLAEAQAYNLVLGGPSACLDNTDMAGGNATDSDILALGEPSKKERAPYGEQLCADESGAMGWLEVPRIGICLPIYHGSSDEVLAQGVGHLEWSSLPVGGTPSHCVLAAHAGMTEARMFDEIDQLAKGDQILLHVLGDCYAYEVCNSEVLLPEDVRSHCQISGDKDLCTLMTCTPYGINTHRLLVHSTRVRYEAQQGDERRVNHIHLDHRRATPLLICLAGLIMTLICTVLSVLARRRRARSTRGQKTRARRGRFVSLTGVMLLIMGVGMLAYDAQTTADYRSLARSFRTDIPQALAETHEDEGACVEGGDDTGGIPDEGRELNWESLRRCNNEVEAWVQVEGTDIDLPVVAPRDGDMTRYLTHDFWGRWSQQGCPFLDYRCDADAMHRLVFGHHLCTGGQFSSLQRSFEQQAFDHLGDCLWQTPSSGSRTLRPLCALRVHKSYQLIQSFGQESTLELHLWLRDILRTADAHTDASEQLIDEAISALTLVTCADDVPLQPWRTLVVFVETPTAQDNEAEGNAMPSQS